MKYYGSIYKGIVGKYDTKDLQGYDTPYDALVYANRSWDADPDLQIPRLLIVLEETDSLERDSIRKEAYFQFTDSKSCEDFAVNAEPIEWSTVDDQKWNGNAHYM